MGDNCSVPANACDDHIRNPLLPNGGLQAAGNRACNINNDGNRCIPSLDPDLGPTYSCVCAEDRWTGDISLSYDNCLKKVTNCDNMICIHGQCVDSQDGKKVSDQKTLAVRKNPHYCLFIGIVRRPAFATKAMRIHQTVRRLQAFGALGALGAIVYRHVARSAGPFGPVDVYLRRANIQAALVQLLSLLPVNLISALVSPPFY